MNRDTRSFPETPTAEPDYWDGPEPEQEVLAERAEARAYQARRIVEHIRECGLLATPGHHRLLIGLDLPRFCDPDDDEEVGEIVRATLGGYCYPIRGESGWHYEREATK